MKIKVLEGSFPLRVYTNEGDALWFSGVRGIYKSTAPLSCVEGSQRYGGVQWRINIVKELGLDAE